MFPLKLQPQLRDRLHNKNLSCTSFIPCCYLHPNPYIPKKARMAEHLRELEALSAANSVNIARQQEIHAKEEKEKRKPPKDPKPPKSPKVPKEAYIATQKYTEALVEEKELKQKIEIVRRIEGYLSEFPQLKKRKAVSVKHSLDELRAECADIENELNSSSSMLIAKTSWGSAHVALGNYFQEYALSVGFDSKKFGEACANSDVYASVFEKPVAQLVIKYGLFQQGPLVQILMGYMLVYQMISQDNRNAGKEPNNEQADNFADL